MSRSLVSRSVVAVDLLSFLGTPNNLSRDVFTFTLADGSNRAIYAAASIPTGRGGRAPRGFVFLRLSFPWRAFLRFLFPLPFFGERMEHENRKSH